MNKHSGSNFDEFLQSEGILEEVSAKAHKRLTALQLADIMQEKRIIKTCLAERMQTSRSQRNTQPLPAHQKRPGPEGRGIPGKPAPLSADDCGSQVRGKPQYTLFFVEPKLLTQNSIQYKCH